MSTPDNLARVPVSPECQDALVRELDQLFLETVICKKDRGMISIVGHFQLPCKAEDIDKHDHDFWKVLHCDYPHNLLLRRHNKNKKKYINTLIEDIKRLNNQKFPPDLYFTPCSTFGNPRQTSECEIPFEDKHCTCRMLWIDADRHTKNPAEGFPLQDAQKIAHEIAYFCESNGIPTPWIVATGRGIQCYWPFDVPVPIDAKRNKNNRDKLQYTMAQLNDIIQNVIDHACSNLKVDRQVSNFSRLLRLPGSIHTKTGAKAHVILQGDTCDWAQFRGLANLLPKPEKKIAILPTQLNSIATNGSRIERLIQWCEGRNYDIIGLRDEWLHLCAVTLVLMDESEDVITQRILDLNDKLKDPLKPTEIPPIIRCDMKKQYKYSNARIIEKLQMTPEEAEQFGVANWTGSPTYRAGTKVPAFILAKQFGDTRIQNKTRNLKRKQNKKDKAAKYQQIPELIQQGYSYRQIAEKLDISPQTVANHIDGK